MHAGDMIIDSMQGMFTMKEGALHQLVLCLTTPN